MSAKEPYTYEGSPLTFNFPSFDVSHIQVSVNDAIVNNYTVSNYTTGLSNNSVSSGGGGTITFSPDITVGDSVVIFRQTPSDFFVNFQDGATLTASELNLNNTAQSFRTDESVLEAGSTPGPRGPAGTVDVSPTTTTGDPGTDASVVNTGTSSAAVLAFTIPRGDPGTPATITSATAVAGTTAGVTLGGTPSARTFEFTLPKGDDGTGFAIRGTLTHTGAPTSTEAPSPSVGDLYIDSNGDGFLYNQNNQWQNVGAIRGPQGPRGDGFTGGSYDASTGKVTFTSSDNLGFTTGDLRGEPGLEGDPGTAATIAPGSVTFGSPAAVTNSGTSSAAVFDFTLPQLWTQDSGTNPSIYYPHNVAVGSNTSQSEAFYVNGNAQITGSVTADTFSGNGSSLTNLDADTLNSQPASNYIHWGTNTNNQQTDVIVSNGDSRFVQLRSDGAIELRRLDSNNLGAYIDFKRGDEDHNIRFIDIGTNRLGVEASDFTDFDGVVRAKAHVFRSTSAQDESNTGIYPDGNDGILMKCNGTDRLVIKPPVPGSNQTLLVNGNAEITGDASIHSGTYSGTITGNTLNLGGSEVLTGSTAKLQVNGFQRTGTIYLHEGASPVAGTVSPLSNNAGDLEWNGSTVWHAGNLDTSTFLRSDVDDTYSGTIIGNKLSLGGSEVVTGSAAKLQVNGAQRTGTIYLHEGNTPIAGTVSSLANDAGALKWDDNTVWHAGNDGSGSGLDADKVDGVQGSSFLRSDAGDNASGFIHLDGGFSARKPSTSWTNEYVGVGGIGQLYTAGSYWTSLVSNGYRNSSGTWTSHNANNNTGAAEIDLTPDGNIYFRTDATKADGSSTVPTLRAQIDSSGVFSVGGNTVWHAGNLDTSSFLRSDIDDTATGEITFASGLKVSGTHSTAQNSEIVIEGYSPQIAFSDLGTSYDFYLHANSNNFYILVDRDGVTGGWDTPHPLQLNAATNTAYTFGNRILTVADEGSGNGLDADTLDGIESSAFIRSNENDTVTARTTWSASSPGLITVNKPSTTSYAGIGFSEVGDIRFYLYLDNSEDGVLALQGRKNGTNFRQIWTANFSTGIQNFNYTPTVGGNAVWHAGNLNPVVANSNATVTGLRVTNGTISRNDLSNPADYIKLNGTQQGFSYYENDTEIVKLGVSTGSSANFINNRPLGLGTTTPSERLHVVGNGLFEGTVTATSLSGNGSSVTNVNAASLGGSSLSDVLSNSSGSFSVGVYSIKDPIFGGFHNGSWSRAFNHALQGTVQTGSYYNGTIKRLMIPAGDYTCNEYILRTKDVKMIGEGLGATKISMGSTAPHTITVDGTTASGQVVLANKGLIQGIRFSGRVTTESEISNGSTPASVVCCLRKYNNSGAAFGSYSEPSGGGQNDSADMDLPIIQCGFTSSGDGGGDHDAVLKYVGRNAYIFGCTFNTNGVAIHLSFPNKPGKTVADASGGDSCTNNDSLSNASQGGVYGWRRCQVIGCYFHLTDDADCIIARGPYQCRGLVIANNLSDIGGRLFKFIPDPAVSGDYSNGVGGGLSQLSLTGNTAMNLDGTRAYVDLTGSNGLGAYHNCSITGNAFAGSDETHNVSPCSDSNKVKRCQTGIEISSGCNVHGLSITGNSFGYFEREAIDINTSSSTEKRGISITGNNFLNCGIDSSTYYVIDCDNGVHGICIGNSYLKTMTSATSNFITGSNLLNKSDNYSGSI